MLKVLIISLLFFACGKGEKTNVPKEYYDYLKEGKGFLAKGEPAKAEDSFEKGLKYYDGDEALYGLVIARGLKGLELINMITSLAFWAPPASSENDEIENYILNIFSQFRALNKEAGDLTDKLLKRNDPAFTIDNLPFNIWSAEVLNLKGKWNKGDLYFLRSYFRAMESIFSFLLSFSLHGDYLGTISFARKYIYGTINGEVIGKIYAYILLHNPDFLKLEDIGSWKEFAEALKESLSSFNTFLKTGGGSIFTLSFQDTGPFLRLGIDPETQNEIVLQLPDLFPNAVSDFVANFEGKVKFLEWKDDIAPVLSVITGIVISILPLAYFKWQIPQQYAALLKTLANPSFLDNLLVGLLPDSFGFDIGSFASRPVGLRNLLPLPRYDLPETSSTLYWEWECQERGRDGYPLGKMGIMCRNDDTFIDSPHFADTKWAIEKDGFAGKLPYLIFPDPTFNNLLYVNLYNFKACSIWDAERHKDNFFLPDLFSLNLWIQYLGECLLNLSF